MFILEAPYVSDFLKQTIADRKAPVLANEMAIRHFGPDAPFLCTDDDFVARSGQGLPVYSNSENAIDWINTHLGTTGLPDTIGVFKDKIRFRELIRDMHPGYVFKGVDFAELEHLDPSAFPKPFIIKPAVGFFSLGVHKVDSDEDWPRVLEAITNEVSRIRSQYPDQVVCLDRFIVEECIQGEEFAVDVYFDHKGEPVILNILGHLFASADDVSDRVYLTSPTIIRTWLDRFTAYLGEMGSRAHLSHFPAHVELRVDKEGHIIPIEVNPMRFAGWCVADLTFHAWGFNPYTYYLDGNKPDWESILAEHEGQAVGVLVADVAADVDCASITRIDYTSLAARFSNPLELRRIDVHEYPVFAFLFARVPENDLREFRELLHSDLKEFLTIART
ncbi:ATP-grasp domain-containing protein [Desulfoplanes formicivorans]|uniref:ATP-grasp domain-containing protein n=1 Tax=Desulfoplanes formicivorans TaxID=1592317 RepID=A0A194AGS5_9BACT|nr:ATP-grasp domain-containing protein [Desulfoplanes formicivorans]GAU08528.1 ATP-grasp domain-containing protein [Desulfoplanes formicivorans]